MAIQSSDELEPHDHAARVIEPGPLRYPPPMDRYLGLHINQVCRNAIVSAPGQNHCAHFVSHVMRWHHIPGAARCGFMSHSDSRPGVHIRVNEIFNVAPNRAAWPAGAALPDPCLVYATIPSNVRPGPPPTFGTHERKHIGLYYLGKIWHYSTFNRQVFADSRTQLRSRMTDIYGSATVYYRSDLVRT